jgi:hypothetical protein
MPQRSFIEQSVCIRFHLRYYPAIVRDNNCCSDGLDKSRKEWEKAVREGICLGNAVRIATVSI